tara:strand:+ start:474 stop:1112 length:639 start_codon:yes stop_codon:yes gene_type:complete
MEVLLDPRTVNSRKVLAGLKLIGADYDVRQYDYFQAEQKSDEFVAVNPNAAFPALIDDDFILWESNAILQYAAEKVGNTNAYPKDIRTRADINRWLLWESSSWFGSCYVYLVENCVKPLLGDTTDESILANEQENFHKLASILDARLKNSTFLCGEEPTIADVAVAAPMHLHGWAKLPLGDYPNLIRWMTKEIENCSWWKETHIGEGFTVSE